MSSGTLAKAPRRMLLSVSSRNQCSTKFSHDELVGLFGPYAGFSTKFLKNRSLTDLFGSVKGDTIKLLLAVGRDNWDLTEYLIKEVLKSSASRYASLLEYFPNAKDTDWELIVAGQRVQVIVPDAKAGGKLEFGTKIVTAGDGSLSAVLGASPGASVSVAMMIGAEMIPSYGRSIAEDAALCTNVRAETAATLGLKMSLSPSAVVVTHDRAVGVFDAGDQQSVADAGVLRIIEDANDRIDTGSQPIGHGRCVTGCIINRAGPDRDEHMLTIAFRCDKAIVQFVQPPFFKLGTRSPKDSPWFQERGGRVFSGADVIAYIATSWRERTSGLRTRSTRRPRG